MITRSKDREEDKILGPDDKVGEMGSFKKKTYEKKIQSTCVLLRFILL